MLFIYFILILIKEEDIEIIPFKRVYDLPVSNDFNVATFTLISIPCRTVILHSQSVAIVSGVIIISPHLDVNRLEVPHPESPMPWSHMSSAMKRFISNHLDT